MMNKKFLLPIGIGLGSVLVLSLVIFFVIAFAANTEDDELTYELALAKAEQMLLIEENKLEMQQASLSAPREVYQANIEVEEEYEYIEEEYEEEPEPLPDPITIRAISALGNPSRGGGLELPVAGATGWAGGYLDLYEEPRHIPPDPVNCLYCNDELCAHCDPYWIEPCAACELCGLCEEEEICMDCVLCEECEELAHALLTGRVSLMRFVSLNYEADYQNELPAQELPYYPEAPETPEAEPAEAYLPHEEIPEEVTPAEYPSECDDCEPEQEPVYQPETYEPETTEYEAQTPRVYRCVCGQLCICWDGCECDQYLCLCMYDCSCGYNCQCEHEQECVCPHVCPCYYCVCGEHCECTQACVCDDYCHCSHDCLCECQCYEEYIPVQIIGRLSPGQVFVILDVHEDFWYIRLPNNNTGWVLHSGCFINLPDVIPSMVFRNTNATASVKRSSWYDIPNVSGYQLYEAWAFNDRLGRYEFIIPVLYQTAHALFVVQQTALAAGDTLIIYEAFRPFDVQMRVVRNLGDLMRDNETVHAALNTPPWRPNMFIAHGTSNHQRGAAIDASIGRIVEYEIRYVDNLQYRHVLEFVDHVMPTPMHELSPAAAAFVSGRRPDTFTEGAEIMARYFGREGFRPLTSEWWHFNHTPGIETSHRHNILGRFFTSTIHSELPSDAQAWINQHGRISDNL